jgi:hypothetical protein
METEMTWIDAVTLGASSCVLGYFAVAMFPSFLDRLRTIGHGVVAAFAHVRDTAPALRLGSRQA